MISQLERPTTSGSPIPGAASLAFAGHRQIHDRRGEIFAPPQAPIRLPQRPDRTVLNETIPLFYIGRNRKGFWVAQAADGRSGGTFFLKHSAVRFAREESEPQGCALMFVAEPLELDAAASPPRQSAFAFVMTVLAVPGRTLLAKIARPFAAARRTGLPAA
jgi:hypothetical protein